MQIKITALVEGRERMVKLNAAQQKVIEQVCKMNHSQKIEFEAPDKSFVSAINRFSESDHLPAARNEEGYKAFITRKNPGV